MAGNKIRGITIEIAGDTSKLSKSLRDADSALRDTQKQLSDVNRLLKLDPKNTELLRQKTELLNKSIEQSKEKVNNLKQAQAQLGERTDKNAAQYDAIEREIIACENAQKAWKKELDAMTSPLKGFHDSMAQISKTTGEWSKKTRALSTAAGAAGAALLGNAYNAAATADDLNTLARNTGFTVEELQKMKYATDFVDVSFEAMTGSVTKLTKNMASGSDAFDTLGVSITDADGNMRDATDVWYDTLAALSKVENETDRDALAMTLFGKSAMELSGIVDDGGAALSEYGKEAEEAGLILSGDTLQSANKLKDTIDKLKVTTSQALLEAGAELAQTLQPAVEKLVEGVTKLVKWFSSLDGTTQAVVVAVLAFVAAISPVLGIISAITGAAAALSAVTLPMIGTLAAVVAAIAAVIAIGVLLYKNWDKIKAAAKTLLDAIKKTFQNIYNSISTAINNAWNTVNKTFNNMKSFVVSTINSIYSSVSSVFNNIKNTISNAFNTAKNTIQSVLSAVQTSVTNGFNAVKTTITNALNGALTSVTNIFNNIKGTMSRILEDAKGVVSGAISAIKGFFNFSVSLPSIGTGALDTAKNAVSGVLNTIKGFFNFSWSLPKVGTGSVDGLWGTISGIVSRIKGLFNFSWSLPTLKVPHVKVDGGAAPWGIGGRGRLPHFEVQWYRKAYDNAVLFNSPTVLPTLAGLKGFGDGNGSEMVIGTNKLMEIMRAAGGNDIDINIYTQPGMSETAIANAVAVKLDRWLGEQL